MKTTLDKTNDIMEKLDGKQEFEHIAIDTCRGPDGGCKCGVLELSKVRGVVVQWLREFDLDGKLTQKYERDGKTPHRKLTVSISCCPNGCSRYQIADVGIVGKVVPFVDPADCTVCGACEENCPDGAIEVDGGAPVFDRSKCSGCLTCRDICPNNCIDTYEPTAKIYLGGRLGRKPHLADLWSEIKMPGEIGMKIAPVLSEYLEESKPGERFADFWVRTNHPEVRYGN